MSDEIETVAPSAQDMQALRSRLLQAELRTAAVRAGMVDLDGIRLLDLGAVPVDGDGVPVDAPAVMAGLRVAKPWLFAANSSSGAAVPRAAPAVPRLAMDMTEEEWRAARAQMLRGR